MPQLVIVRTAPSVHLPAAVGSWVRLPRPERKGWKERPLEMRRRHGAVCGSRIERVQASLQGVWAGPRPKSACRPSSGLFTCPVRVQTAEWLPPPATDHQSCAWPVFSERRSDPISPPIEMRLSSRPPPPSRSDLPPSRRRGRTRCSVHSVGEVRVRSSPLPKRPLPPSPQLNRRVDPRLELCTTAREWYAPAANRRGRRVSWGSSEGIASAGDGWEASSTGRCIRAVVALRVESRTPRFQPTPTLTLTLTQP